MRKTMTSNEQKLRRLISNEIKTIIKESVRPRRTLASLIFEDKIGNLKDVAPEEVAPTELDKVDPVIAKVIVKSGAMDKDKGDDAEGFGNLAVIEKGKYTGGETCLPQYGIGVDVRNNDILYMDVHEWHGNLPIKLIDKNATRVSNVCYLRYNIWEKTKHKTKKFMIKHNKTIKNLRKHK